jgi:glycosyltransferase involved in cell wall biosynthesis
MSSGQSASRVEHHCMHETGPQIRDGGLDHIGVCIPTYKRPDLLKGLLAMLGRQKSGGFFRYSVHVVDNDGARSAKAVVIEFASRAPFLVTYAVEPVQNISLARNRALRCAEGNLLAFIDDDEIPTEEWLLNLYLARRASGADGVIAHVLPLFDTHTPSWLIKSGLCERPSFRNGTVLTDDEGRTGNALLRRDVLDGLETPFRPEKGRTGGEDAEFFRTLIAQGHIFVWCDDAPVYEHIGPSRCRKQYYIERALRIGGLVGKMLRESRPGRWPATLKSLCAMSILVPLAIIGLCYGDHLYARYAAKAAYHIGLICGSLGFVPIRYKPDA